MRKVSKVLGIVGGVLSLVMGVLCILGGVLLMTFGSGIMTDIIQHFSKINTFDTPGFIFDFSAQISGVVMIFVGFFSAASGVLGLIGGTMVLKNNVTAGVLMIVAAGIGLLLSGGWIATILLILGGIFALVKEKQPQAPPFNTPGA